MKWICRFFSSYKIFQGNWYLTNIIFYWQFKITLSLASCDYNLKNMNDSITIVLREKSCPFSSSNTFLFFFIFVVFYCIVTISVFCYIFFVLFCLVITLFNFYNLFLKFSQQKVGSWEDRQYCLYETTVDSQNYVYICLWLFAEIYTYLLTYLSRS